MSYSSDSDQARHYVGPDLGPNCLQRLSADDTSRYRVKCTKLFSEAKKFLVEIPKLLLTSMR